MSNAREIAQLGSVPSGRRRINHNGAMTVAQRGTSDTVTSLAKFVCDRWAFNYANTDELAATVSQDTDAPDGFAYSFKWTTNTGETSLASDEYAYVYQKIEGQDLQSLSYGSASAKPVTLSFWVKSSVTGTYAAGIYAADGLRIINLTYTINSANTWEYKTITFAGDVAGTIDNDNTEGLRFLFHLAAGSGWTTTDATSWVNYTTTAWAYGHAQNGVITTTNATWQITGIQLEVGSVATEFEHRSFGEELALCQRYLYRIGRDISGQRASAHNGTWYTSGSFYGVVHFPVKMRGQPAFTFASVTDGYSVFGGGYANFCDAPHGVQAYGFDSTTIAYFDSLNGTAGHSGWVELNKDGAYLQFDAEL
jgi:hypothetical protein